MNARNAAIRIIHWNVIVILTETQREWVVYRLLELKKWRREAATKLWKEEGLAPIYIEKAPDDIIMPDDCVLALAKNAKDLTNLETRISFLKP